MNVSDVRPGMKGYGLTVFEGDRPDRFEIEILDVIADYLPKQDAILFTSPDPRMLHAGIAGGMSGSPGLHRGQAGSAGAWPLVTVSTRSHRGITRLRNMLGRGVGLPHRKEVLPHPRGRARSGNGRMG